MSEKMIINANLIRKESEFRTKSCVVEKAIAVSHAEFDDLKRHPLRDNKLIAKNADLMYCDRDDNYHCLLIYDNMRTIVCEPADSYADIDPDKKDEAVAPKIKVNLPKYADRNEKIDTKIEKLNDTEISWYSVIFNGNTAVNVGDEGNFSLTMPNRDGTYKVVVRAFDWAGKSDVQEYEIIVDSIVPAVEIMRSSDEAMIGSEAFFKIKVTGEHKIKSVEYTLNGEKIDIPENGIVSVDTDKEAEYVLEAKGETIKGKSISASAKITVIEADTENPEVKITFDKSSYNENGTAVITVNATDNVGVTKLDVFVNGEAVTLDKDGKFKITGLKYGDYIITANAFDAAGNKGTTSKTLTAKDVTKPTLELKADKAEVKVGEEVNISVIAADNNGVVSTELTINNKKVDLSENNTAVFTPDKEGKYVVKATASDPSGNTITKQLTITAVQPDTIAPTVTLAFDKDTYFEDDDIVISVSATDNVGVTKTILLVDGKEVELDKDGNYTVKKAEFKDYEIIAKAYDAENNEGTATSTVPKKLATVPVLIWELDARDLPILNKYEGWPRLYRQEKMSFEMDGKSYEGMAYLMNRGEISPPSQQYYNTILQGYRENGLDESYLKTALENSLQQEQFMDEEFDEDFDFDDDLQMKF